MTYLFCADLAGAAGNDFQQAYAQWSADRQSPRNLTNTHAAGPYICASFHAIIRLGPVALPEIIEKLPSDPLLQEAVIVISQKKFPSEYRDLSSRDRIGYLQTWWATAEEATAAKFNEESALWKQAKRDKDGPRQSVARENVRELGILALPHLFSEIAKRETDFIPVASQLVGNAFPPTATPAQCAEWWQQNKTKWSLPPRTGQTKTKESP